MTDEQLDDLEECSQMFDFCGFTVEEDRCLVAEAKRLRQALRDVCAPVQYVLRKLAPDERRHVDGALLVRMARTLEYVQHIASDALAAAP